jgi:4-hydroxy-L-threonine phosphate dehydrogenase PdxA
MGCYSSLNPLTVAITHAPLATTHIPLREVPAALNPDLMTRKLDLLIESLKLDFGIDSPKNRHIRP